MIRIIKDWYGYCGGCGELNEKNILTVISIGEYGPGTGSLILCPKCRCELVKKLIALKEE